jgi:hypothetical protein
VRAGDAAEMMEGLGHCPAIFWHEQKAAILSLIRIHIHIRTNAICRSGRDALHPS